MKLAISGTSGRVGRALADYFAPKHEVIELDRTVFDFADPDLISRVGEIDFDALLNPAAITSLEACEDDPGLARRVNAEVPGELAAMCRESGRRIMHFSTDYVLAGEVPGLHVEEAAVEPCSVYARTKLAGEQLVLDQGGCVVRVSWVFGPERKAFPDQVIERALAGESLAAVADKTSLPTSTADLAVWVEKLMAAGFPNEVIHACNGGEPVSWHGMAEVIVALMMERGALKELPVIERQLLAEMRAFRAKRPRHTAMATPRLSALLGEPPRDWKVAIREHVIEQLISR
ncbi:SDR family oxidoreductase [Haloferula chungangensis]|uniref:dTDP-4-dehydrorhamnose reductase n=1 Tax=Haloferula chungangensis TaxID=1048331 RepID=A0ABW2L7Z4_9BACT